MKTILEKELRRFAGYDHRATFEVPFAPLNKSPHASQAANGYQTIHVD
jgi:hypothetical protein